MSRLAKQLNLPPAPSGLSPIRRYRTLGFPYRAPSTPRGVAPAPKIINRGADYDATWARKYPARLARAAIVEGPAIFAANHHSHLDTPLLLTSIPEPWRHQILVGAAADYFFGTRSTSALSS